MKTLWSSTDHHHMAHALRLARRGRQSTHPNPSVGCVLVTSDGHVHEGWHERAGEPHAEVFALRSAGEAARGATCYVTLEPCSHTGKTPPCADALVAAGVGRVVVAMQDPNPKVSGAGISRLREAGIQVECGLLEKDAEALNTGFIKRMREGRPWIRCKLAMSLDGRTAMASGESQWITSPQARADVQRLRAESAAVMTGIETVLADDCRLTVRDREVSRQPVRVVLDSLGRLPADAAILGDEAPIWVCSGIERNVPGAEVIFTPLTDGHCDLQAVVKALADRQINEVLLECGPTLAGAMLRAGLIDEFIIYAAPLLLGDNARGLLKLPGLSALSDAGRLRFTEVRTIGPDLRITAVPEPAANQ